MCCRARRRSSWTSLKKSPFRILFSRPRFLEGIVSLQSQRSGLYRGKDPAQKEKRGPKPPKSTTRKKCDLVAAAEAAAASAPAPRLGARPARTQRASPEILAR